MSKYIYSGVVRIPYKEVKLHGFRGGSSPYYGDLSVEPFKEVAISKIIYSKPATVVLWDDDTKTVAKCAPGDTYSKETGLAICILKKVMGPTAVHDVFADWIMDKNIVEVSDVRNKYKGGEVK